MADRFLVTGGGGFLGKALCLRLRAAGHDVISLSRGSYPEVEQAGVKTLRCDIAGLSAEARAAFEGVAAVFHTAAHVDMWGDYQTFYRTNVSGTEAVISACLAAGVPRLVYTSSPSVVAGAHDLCNADESTEYPSRYLAFYPETKALAERMVRQAGAGSALHTVCLRPHLIFGPGDTNLTPTILEKADAGRLKIIGDGKNLSDFCYIEDCVSAHVEAEIALRSRPELSGRVYFITQGEPFPLWGFVNEVLRRSGRKPLGSRVPAWLAARLAIVAEYFAKLGLGPKEPVLTRFLVSEMSTSHYFDISAARRDLGFEPQYSMAEALDLTFGSFNY